MTDSANFNFIFVDPEEVDNTQLLQGDLLRRTPALAAAIGQAHSYYAEAEDYSHFLVLTQSCDLARRSGKCKSRYITICAVRPLSVAVNREMEKFTSNWEGFPFLVGEVDRGILARQFLERVLNNTVDGIFFIPRGSARTADVHLCAFLSLSVALRVDHYDVCLSAKVGQAKEIFAAKIGSLASGLYGRIATPDLQERNSSDAVALYKEQFFQELGWSDVAWLSPVQKKSLKSRVKKALGASAGSPLTKEDAIKIMEGLPNETLEAADRVIQILSKRKLLADESEKSLAAAKSYLVNDPSFKKLTRR